MNSFINENFLLKSEEAVELYHSHSKKMPIFDYHCHLNPKDILDNRNYDNITQIWLYGDHYKWRLMRAAGIDEQYITGNASDYEKFQAWAKTVPLSLGNPIYHWTHMELKRYFDIDLLLSPDTAKEIWDRCNEKLQSPEFTPRGMMEKMNVKATCTTDDPVDDLSSHITLKADSEFGIKVLPTFRPDKAIHIENEGYLQWVQTLTNVSNVEINHFEDLIKALRTRAEFFKSVGCLLSDQSFSSPNFMATSMEEAEKVFKKAMNEECLTQQEIDSYQTMLMIQLGRIYHELDFAMQLHIGVIRNNNTRMFQSIGHDSGFDSIGDTMKAEALVFLFDSLEKEKKLPRTVIYSLNPNDNEKLITIAGCYQGDNVFGKMQYGSAWWFLDHKDGMEEQMKTLSSLGLLSSFVGMLTDSRSFLSYTRHEYFRRILCNLIGDLEKDGEIPRDQILLGQMIENISYNNAALYFKLNK